MGISSFSALELLRIEKTVFFSEHCRKYMVYSSTFWKLSWNLNWMRCHISSILALGTLRLDNCHDCWKQCGLWNDFQCGVDYTVNRQFCTTDTLPKCLPNDKPWKHKYINDSGLTQHISFLYVCIQICNKTNKKSESMNFRVHREERNWRENRDWENDVNIHIYHKLI